MNAIPTTYQGIRFRSRLEARWAAAFDNLGWPWVYEPIDLAGYIPDFILDLAKPMLVEVKPALSLQEAKAFTQKLESSGWSGEALITTAYPLRGELFGLGRGIALGMHAERGEHDGDWCWGPAIFQTCSDCGRPSIFNGVFTYSCRTCGGHSYGGNPGLERTDTLCLAWGESTNRTQGGAR